MTLAIPKFIRMPLRVAAAYSALAFSLGLAPGARADGSGGDLPAFFGPSEIWKTA